MSIDVAVIGGGISGLAVAYELRRQGRSVCLLERQRDPGGKAFSEPIGGFLMEHGPSTVRGDSPVAAGLATSLGLDGGRCTLGSGVRQRYLVGSGRLHGISVHPLGFLLSDYLSPLARVRVMAEWAVPRKRTPNEESVMAFFARRFGRQFAERVVEPLVAGLYSGDAVETSMSAVFPRLVEMERDEGPLSLALLRRFRRGRRAPVSRLYSWREGIGTLPGALADRLGDAVRTGIAVRRIQASTGGYRIDTGAAGSLEARSVVIATQPHVAAQLLEGLDGMAADAAGAIDAPPLAVAFLGFKRRDVEHPLDGLGFLCPQGEGRNLLGTQFCSTMFPGRAPRDHVAVSAYIGGVRRPDLARLPAAEVIALAREEFRDLIGARGEPVIARVRHWPVGIPQYRLGHGRLIADLRALSDRMPGLFLTGNFFSGPSVTECLSVARETAGAVTAHLAEERDVLEAQANERQIRN